MHTPHTPIAEGGTKVPPSQSPLSPTHRLSSFPQEVVDIPAWLLFQLNVCRPRQTALPAKAGQASGQASALCTAYCTTTRAIEPRPHTSLACCTRARMHAHGCRKPRPGLRRGTAGTSHFARRAIIMYSCLVRRAAGPGSGHGLSSTRAKNRNLRS